MKAIISGITVEGTPQEISEYQRLQEQRLMEKTPDLCNWPPNKQPNQPYYNPFEYHSYGSGTIPAYWPPGTIVMSKIEGDNG